MLDRPLPATNIANRLREALTATGSEAEFEGFCGGDPQTKINRVLVCHTPTVGVLRQATALNCQLIISREHPFFTHGTWYASGTEQALRDDPVATSKRRLIEEGRLVVYRLSSAWDRARPQAQATALAEAMGWHAEPGVRAAGFRGVTCSVGQTTLLELAQLAQERLGARTLRAVGGRTQSISRVVVLPGLVDTKTFGIALRDQEVDGILAGEANEWEGAPYIKDAIDSGRSLGIVYVGFALSEGQAVTAMARWIKEVVPELAVESVPVTAPAWISSHV